MKGTSKNGPVPEEQAQRPVRPSAAQVLWQIGVIVLVVAIWAGLLVGYLNLTGRSDEPAVASPTATEVAVVPTVMASAVPTNTALPTEEPTATEEPATPTAPEPGPTETAAPGLTATATEPPPTASDTPTMEPTATELPPTDTATVPPAGGISFAAEVLPVLTARCERCHGEGRAEAGLKLTSYADVMNGSENGPVVVPGSAATSSLVELIVSGDMPRRSPRLPESEIQTISTWVDEGALDN